MPRWFTTQRLAPIVAGVAGLTWFWAELAQQATAYQDTDNPAQGLAFIAANPLAWPLAGLALGIAAVALVATVLATRAGLNAAQAEPARDDANRVAVDTISVLGLVAAAMLFGMAAVRMSGGPVRYVQGLDQAWGEAAYLVTQFVGIQALVTGGLIALDLWIVGVAWIGARRRVVRRVVAGLAVLPGLRLAGIVGPFGIEVDGLWLLLMLAIPASFAWLAVLGATLRTPTPMSTGDTLALSPAVRDSGGRNLGEASA